MEKVAIVIPNCNGEGYLKECLKSLNRINYNNFSIVMVDNGSSDNSIQMVKNNFPDVVVITNNKNLGFAGACNQGIKYALENKAGYILLLNNDTIVDPYFLDKMVLAAEENKVGIVGAKIYYFNKPKKIWFAGGKFIKWRSSGKHNYWMKNESKELTGIIDSDFITGCAMLIKKDVFADIGYFYEPYFLTVEDLDFCYLAKKSGWEIKVALDAKIYHKVSFSRQGEFSFSNGYYGTRNRLCFSFRRNNNYLGGFILLFIILPIRLVQWFVQAKFSMIQGAIIGVVHFFKGKMGIYS